MLFALLLLFGVIATAAFAVVVFAEDVVAFVVIVAVGWFVFVNLELFPDSECQLNTFWNSVVELICCY